MHAVHSQPVQAPTRPRYLSLVDPPNRTRPPSDSDELGALLRAVAEGADRQAFAALFKHFAPRVKAYLMRTGSPEPLAEDLAQETLVQVWRKAASFDAAQGNASTWVFTIARNLRVDQVRRRGLNQGSGIDADDEVMDEHAPSAEELVRMVRRERGVRDALARLTLPQAQLLRLSFFEERPHGQIAQELGMPLGTVKSRIRAAVGRLRELLDGIES